MKKYLYILIAAVLMLMAGSCRRTSHNGKIDGNWRLMNVEFTESGTSTDFSESDIFININLELMQIRGPQLSPQAYYTGVMDWNEKSGKLGVNFAYDANADLLTRFGIFDNPVVFTVKVADSKHLVLETDKSVITCNRF